MIDQKIKRRVKVPRTKKYKRLQVIALFNILLLVFNLFSYFWISGPGVLDIEAADVGLCLTICPQGEDDCSMTDCADLISPPPATEEEEEEEIVEEETTVVPAQAFSISPLSTPLGLVSQEQIIQNLVLAEADVAIYNKIETIIIVASDVSADAESIPIVADQIPVISAANSSSGGGTHLIFQGKTNIKNAIIIITLSSPQIFYATARADEEGNWQWTVPGNLTPGLHHLTVVAMSPSNAQVKQVYEMEFYVEAPIEPEIEIPSVEVKPIVPFDILPSIKLPPIEITKDIYVLDLEVIAEEKVITPGREISLVINIISFDPAGEEEITLTFIITDQLGQVIFDDVDLITLKDSVSVIKRLGLKKTIEPGNYIATVILTKEDVNYLTSVGFRVQEAEEEALVLLPGRIIVRRTEAQKGLFTSFVFLSFLLIFFVILLRREYQRSKKEIQITGKDLYRSGEIIH